MTTPQTTALPAVPEGAAGPPRRPRCARSDGSRTTTNATSSPKTPSPTGTPPPCGGKALTIPGRPAFIAGSLVALEPLTFHYLFEVVERPGEKQGSVRRSPLGEWHDAAPAERCSAKAL
ncbi:hypothetical protein GCM10009634_37970 [Saccharothrix xinjiangensis]